MQLNLTKDLSKIKEEACSSIDSKAEKERLQYITTGSAQAMVYLQKRMEAEQVSANPNIDPNLVPHIKAEADAFGISLFDQAVIVLTMAHQWSEQSKTIEVKRLQAKNQVMGSQSVFEINNIVSGF